MTTKGNKARWTKVADEDVRHVWKCGDPQGDECKGKVFVTPDWYADNGTPVCGGCDCDMAYAHTEVRRV